VELINRTAGAVFSEITLGPAFHRLLPCRTCRPLKTIKAFKLLSIAGIVLEGDEHSH